MLKEQFDSFGPLKPMLGRERKEELALLEKHFALLREWNEHIGLVSRKSIEKSAVSHYLDSIQIVDFAEKLRDRDMPVYDLGSGAGFPGLIYAIRYPKTKVQLFERMLKKQGFLMAALAQLELDNVTLAGDFPMANVRGLVVGRAVFPPAELFPFMAKRLTPGSKLIVNLGGQAESLPPFNDFRLVEEAKYDLPFDSGSRKIFGYTFVPRGTKKT